MQRRRCACDKRFGSGNSSTTKRCTDSGLQVDSTEELLFGGFVISLCVRNQELSDDDASAVRWRINSWSKHEWWWSNSPTGGFWGDVWVQTESSQAIDPKCL